MVYEDMKPGQEYMVQVVVGPWKFIGVGYKGTFKKIELDAIVLENATQVDLVKLAFGIKDAKSLEGEVRIPLDMVNHISGQKGEQK